MTGPVKGSPCWVGDPWGGGSGPVEPCCSRLGPWHRGAR